VRRKVYEMLTLLLLKTEEYHPFKVWEDKNHHGILDCSLYMLICDGEALRIIFYDFTLQNNFSIIISHLYLQARSCVMGTCKCWERSYTEMRLCTLRMQ